MDFTAGELNLMNNVFLKTEAKSNLFNLLFKNTQAIKRISSGLAFLSGRLF